MERTAEITMYEAVLAIRSILEDLEAKLPRHEWTVGLSKLDGPLSNAEFNLARIIVRQAVSSMKDKQ